MRADIQQHQSTGMVWSQRTQRVWSVSHPHEIVSLGTSLPALHQMSQIVAVEPRPDAFRHHFLLMVLAVRHDNLPFIVFHLMTISILQPMRYLRVPATIFPLLTINLWYIILIKISILILKRQDITRKWLCNYSWMIKQRKMQTICSV